MQWIASVVLWSVVSVAACGGSAPATEAPAAATAAEGVAAAPSGAASAGPSTAAPSTAAAPAESPRAKDATKWLKDLQDPQIDMAQRGKVATNGLSEEEFGLPASLRKAMAAMTSSSVDPSQSATIIAVTLREAPMSDVMAKQCGKPVQDVMDAARKAKPAEQAKIVVQQCKLDALLDGADVAKLSYASVLLSAVVQRLLEADPKHNGAELGLAKLTANLYRLDAK